MPGAGTFGSELRRRRVAAGVSLAQLAKLLHYSKGYLSKIETGGRQPAARLARQADAVLDAGGALAALVSAADEGGLPAPRETSHLLDRQALMTFGSALLLPLEVRPADAEAAAEDAETERYFREQFDRCRALGQHSPPGLVLRQLVMELHTLQELVEAAREPRVRARLSLLAARYAEYAGWMAQESARADAALAWTRKSAQIAATAGNPALSAYALVREAELAMYAHDPLTTVALARRAADEAHADARIRGLAGHREAQGHALMGDYGACRAALDRATALLTQQADSGPGGPVLGSSTVADLDLAVSGWCYYDLGRPGEAAGALERVLAVTPATARRARALYGARLALAYEAMGELDRMCEVAQEVLARGQALGSATVRGELRDLSRNMLRRHGHRPALELHAELNAALQLHR
ncbi:transcriptional regulator with XRE-family HTH domain [Saccharothrix tamanrassetensis]|uniref:Transcriptional regulator with XRE-family HTH domain n=1 Tax=Saccharothrix tamanrassetensis TaxID=1051531 RepID=A0A841CUG3_9PSEU|nr:helix-turn-helix transcriptional regulator [Saccharothrix tamanrassetensis]MBB5959585.1 transcriptional regulator with XRE-family HTH domain [Saccharothrix tamanrassetensis]